MAKLKNAPAASAVDDEAADLRRELDAARGQIAQLANQISEMEDAANLQRFRVAQGRGKVQRP